MMQLPTSSHTLSDLEIISEFVFKICGVIPTNVEKEREGQDYFAQSFKINGQKVIFRTAKITPTKTGQFVTVWKRDTKKVTAPYHVSDNIALYIIAARQEKNFGVFIFKQQVLLENGIMTSDEKPGKLGIRVYPSWSLPTNNQAKKTQSWQTKCFLEFKNNHKIDVGKAEILLNIDRQNAIEKEQKQS